MDSKIAEVTESTNRRKVFLSHAQVDKERVVTSLDELLRERGLDVWLDERDLLPGQDIVKEIFKHGISESDAFVIVLTANSIHRPWVKEELSNAVVQRINGIVQHLIPVILDDVQPPAELAHIIQERVRDLDALPRHADRIASAIYGKVPPPVAAPPRYVSIPVHHLPGLEADDERIFAIACEQVIETSHPFVDYDAVLKEATKIGMPEDLVWESIAILKQHGYVNHEQHGLGHPHPNSARIRSFYFDSYLRHYHGEEYTRDLLQIVSTLVHEEGGGSRELAAQFSISEYIVSHILKNLELSGDLMASHTLAGIHVRTKVTLRRFLRRLESESIAQS